VQDYFTKVLEDDLKAVVKPQYVDQIPKAVKGPDRTVESLLKARNQMGNMDEIMDVLGRTFHLTYGTRLMFHRVEPSKGQRHRPAEWRRITAVCNWYGLCSTG